MPNRIAFMFVFIAGALLAACAAPSTPPPPTPTPDTSPMETSIPEPLLLYTFNAGVGDVVEEQMDTGLDLTITVPPHTDWVAGSLNVLAPTLITTAEPPTALIEAVTESGQITVELWVTPSNTTQNGPARLFTISADSENRNITVGQGVHNGPGDFYEVRLRTSATDDNGRPSLAAEEGSLTADLTHVVYTFDGEAARLYINGEEAAASAEMAGDLSNWDGDYLLALGDEFTGERSWLGAYHHLVVYDEALNAAMVEALWEDGVPVGGPTAALPNDVAK